jgi:hypothetical protein
VHQRLGDAARRARRADITTDPRIPQAAYATTHATSLIMVPVRTPAVAAIGLSTAPWAPTFTSDGARG